MVRERADFSNAFPIIVDLVRGFPIGLAVNIGNEEESIAGRVNIETWFICCTSCEPFCKGIDCVLVVGIGAV